MLDEIISDSRHKFIYFDDSKRALVIGECFNSNINLDISMPIYIKDNGLPEDDSLLDLDKYRLIIFHERYFDFLIALSVIDALCMKIGKDILNKKLLRMFNILSYSSKNNITNIDNEAITNVTPYIIKLISQFPFVMFAPTIVDVITDGNLTSVDISINLNGFIGRSPPINTIKSFGVAGKKNSINKTIFKFLGFFNILLFIILSTFSLSNSKITGISEQAPNINLTPLKVKAPTNSAPTLCATNAKPQIIAVKNNNIVDLSFVFI